MFTSSLSINRFFLKVVLLFLILFGFQSNQLQAQVVTQVVIGATSGTGGWAYGPIYRNTGNTGILNYSRHAYLYTAAELGIPSGSKIVKLEWLKKDTSQITGNNSFSVWVSNTTATTFASSVAWSALTPGMLNSYSSTTFSVTGGANTYIAAPFTDSLIYNGAGLQILTDWGKLGYATAAVPFYINVAAGKSIGTISNVAFTSTATLTAATYGGYRPTIRITYVTVPPCTGTPTPGNTLGNVSSVCPGGTVMLSLQNTTSGNQVTYQWQSADNLTFTTNLLNLGTGSSQTTTQSTAKYYRCKVSCGATATFAYSTPLYVSMSPQYACYCASAAQSDADEDIFKFTLGTLRNCSSCSSLAPGAGSVLNIYANYQSVTAPVVQKGATIPFGIDIGLCANNIYPNRSAIFIDFNQNSSFADAGELVYSSSTSISGAHTETGTITIPSTALTGTTGVRVITSEQNTAITDPCLSYPWGETEDYLISIQPSTACTGTPAPGNTVADASGSCTLVSGTYAVCSGKTANLTISAPPSGTGFSYQWYENNFPISGATNVLYTTNAISVSKTYYCRVTCANSGLSANATPITITLSSYLNCYCTSTANNEADADILTVTINGVTNSSDCLTAAGGTGSALNRYGNYTNLGNLTNLNIGNSIPFSIFVDDCDVPPAPYYSFGTAIWIDFNHDGSFTDAGEQVFVEGTVQNSPRTITGNFTVPCTALPGQTRMRIIAAEGLSGVNLTPCLAYGSGETEDYLINLVQSSAACTTPIPAPGNTLSTVSNFCDSTTAVLSLQNRCLSTAYSYQWYKNSIAITGATSNTYTTPMLTATATYYCKVSCGATFVNSTAVSITKSSTVVSISPSATSYCPTSGISVTLTASGATTYAWSPASSLSSSSGASVIATPSSTTTYTVTGLDANGCVRTATQTIQTVTCGSGSFTVKLYAQGYYQSAGTMVPAAYNQGASAVSTFTDSIDIVLHQSVSPYGIVAIRRAAMNINGIAAMSFPSTLTGTYYIAVKHRNLIETWSATAVSLSTGLYDFTTAANKAYGSNQVLVETGKWGMYSGDVNSDENIDLIDMSLIEDDVSNFLYGFLPTDINGDGNVDLIDMYYPELNTSSFIYSTHP
jgi:hypothetical protein